MKKFVIAAFFAACLASNLDLSANQPALFTNLSDRDKSHFKQYTISGTFLLGSINYTYSIVIDADICVICNPPYIHINQITSLTICIKNTTVSGSVGVTRIDHDIYGNLEHVEFTVSGFENSADVKNFLNDALFQEQIRNDLLNAASRS